MSRSRLLVVVLVAIAVAVVAWALRPSGESTGPEATAPTAASSPSAALSPVPTRPPGSTSVLGMFTEPRPVAADSKRQLTVKPASAFPEPDRFSTVLYDLDTKTVTNLGPGSLGWFSPDGTKMVWVAGDFSKSGTGPDKEVWLFDLKTGEKRDLGPGRFSQFFDDQRVIFIEQSGNNRFVLNLATGQREDLRTEDMRPGLGSPYPLLKDGSRLRGDAGQDSNRYQVVGSDGRVRLEFDAYRAAPAGPDELVVATPLQGSMTNIFSVKISTGEAEFVATADTGRGGNWPLAASADFVAWVDRYCGPGDAVLRIYDRKTRAMTEVTPALWVDVTPGGLLALSQSGFGANGLVDPKSLQWLAVLPGGIVDTHWSSDFRFASQGYVGGHGGLCG